ncbi:hypothetical protein CBF23_000280 [Marinomonas agarivorans]|nr:hypothetical protein CBF23_000280 [Marinomonas agarivorans]
MDSIEQYEALLKKWGYEEDAQLQARRQARVQTAKKVILNTKTVAVALLKLVTVNKISSHKLAA